MSMHRRPLVAGGIALLVAPRIAFSQPATKVWRIGVLSAWPRPADGDAGAPFRESLQVLGHSSKNIVYEGRWGESRIERLPALAAELSALKVDVIVTIGGAAAMAAKQTTSTIPIVVIFPGDTVETGLVASLSRPGGNVTGVNDPAAVLSAKRLEFLKELAPAAKRVAVLYNSGDHAMELRYREIETAAKALRMSVEPLRMREPDDFEHALSAMSRARPDAVMMLTDALTGLNLQRFVDYAAQHQIPGMYEFDFLTRAGGLMSYGSDLGDNFKIAAAYISKIMNGAKPGDLPVEQPNRYYLVVNSNTAKALGLTIPKSLQVRADEVIR
jgi:putative ABC transport system substrate-binding protein